MSEAQHLADSLAGLFSYSDHGLFTPITVAVANLTAKQAARVPAERFNSVWAVVNHVRFWQEVALGQLRGQPVDRRALGAENGWPPVGDPEDDQTWHASRDRMIAVNQELALLAERLSDEELAQPCASGPVMRWQIVQGVIAHNSYHTCEIISIRHMLGLWLERS